MDVSANWANALFYPNESIGYKQSAEARVQGVCDENTQFFIINPLKNIAQGNFLNNIKACRNFLIEFDGGESPEEQWKYMQEIRLPYTTCTFSGGKSMHFIIALTTEIDIAAYDYYARVLVNSIDGADKLINPNRASRLPNAIRSNGVKQELIEVRERVDSQQFTNWLLFGPLAKKAGKVMHDIGQENLRTAEARALHKARVDSGAERLSIPTIYRNMQNKGEAHPEARGRHESLVKFGVWMFENGYYYDEIAEELHLAAVGLGVDDRRDDKNVLNWLFNKRKRG